MAGFHPVLAGQLDGRLRRRRPAAEKINLVQRRRHHLGDFARQGFDGLVRKVLPVDVGHRARLFGHRLGNLAHAVPYVDDQCPTRTVEVPLALIIVEINPFSAHDLRQRRGQRPIEDVALGKAEGHLFHGCFKKKRMDPA